jgi:hypothetical protein
MSTSIQQPYKGRWNLSRNDVSIGVVLGDYKSSFTARDQFGRTLGYYDTSSEAIDAVEFVADIRDLEVTWLLTQP